MRHIDHEVRVADLVKAAWRVLTALKSGHHPTFEQIEKLEGTLAPFTEMKICGHIIDEECSCSSSVGTRR